MPRRPSLRRRPARAACQEGPAEAPCHFLPVIIAQFRKVVWPTRNQLTTYTTVVIVFVVIMIGLVTVIDYGLNHAAKYVFG